MWMANATKRGWGRRRENCVFCRTKQTQVWVYRQSDAYFCWYTRMKLSRCSSVGRALDLGSRGRRFESCHFDQGQLCLASKNSRFLPSFRNKIVFYIAARTDARRYGLNSKRGDTRSIGISVWERRLRRDSDCRAIMCLPVHMGKRRSLRCKPTRPSWIVGPGDSRKVTLYKYLFITE